jgi:hypothetical protein
VRIGYYPNQRVSSFFPKVDQVDLLNPAMKTTCMMHIDKLTPSALRHAANQGITQIELEDLSAYPSGELTERASMLGIELVVRAAYQPSVKTRNE